MPNYCENDLQLYGEPQEVKKVIDFIAGENGVFDFNKVYPYPEKYEALDEVARQFNAEAREIGRDNPDALLALREKYGLTDGQAWPKDGYNQGGYEWCNRTWGTKWNACDPVLEARQDGAEDAVYHFETAWAPPIPVISRLAEMFPNVELTHEWYERGMAFCGSAQYKNGELACHAEGKYYGNRGG